MKALQKFVDALSLSCEPGDLQLLQGRLEDCFQPFLEAQQLMGHRRDGLEKLEAFLQTQSVAANVLLGLRQTVESAGAWDQGKVHELQQELKAIVPDIGRLEALAVSLDGSLCKARYHLCRDEQRTSCRVLADTLSLELEAVQNLLGTKQSEAEALSALWATFRQRKEQLLKSVEDIEEKADHQVLGEPSLLALQQRYF